MSIEIMDFNIEELKKFIEPYDIIILGGGPLIKFFDNKNFYEARRVLNI
jgi:hypothetical protein